MVQPLKFRDDVFSRLPPVPDLLAKLEEALQTTHRITQANDASNIPLPKVMKHVVDTLAEVVKIEVRPLLIDTLTKHLNAACDEYEMDEGGSEGLSVEEAKSWWQGLIDTQVESLEGEVIGIVGEEAVRKCVENDDEMSALADLILQKPIDDTGAMKIRLGITPEQLQPLMRKVHSNWAVEPENQESEVVPDGTAPQDPPAPATGGAEPSKRSRLAKVDVSPTTEASRLLIEAMYAYSAVRDEDLAKALGVSRPQINNYRHGRQNLSPDDAQAEALVSLARKHLDGLSRAVEAFELTVL